MESQFIGQVIFYLRKKQNLSQAQLAEGVCTSKYIYSLEKGKYNPTSNIIQLLSNKLNADIYEYCKILLKHGSFDIHEKILMINELIATYNYEKLQQTILELENLKPYRTGEPFQILCYAKAICLMRLHNDYQGALIIGSVGLQTYKNFDINTIRDNLYSNVEYTLINIIATSYLSTSSYELAIKIYADILYSLDHHLNDYLYNINKSKHFETNLYNSISCNLSSALLETQKYDDALTVLDAAIKLSTRTNFTKSLPQLMENKIEALYSLERYEESKLCYDYTLMLYMLFSRNQFLLKLEKAAPIKYPKIFNQTI